MGLAAAFVGPAMGVLGIGTGIASAVVQSQAEATATAAKVQEDKVNQQLQLGMAASVMQKGEFEAMQSTLRGGEVVGQERAGAGASGIDANSGSSAALQASSRAMAGLDAQQATNNAMRQAWGYQVTANQYGAQAGVDQQLGHDQQIATALGAAGSALGGVGGLVGKAPAGGDGGDTALGGSPGSISQQAGDAAFDG